MSYDLVVRGGTVVTAADRFAADIGIRGGRIVAIGDSLPRGARRSGRPRPPGAPWGGGRPHSPRHRSRGHAERRRLRVGYGGGRRRGHHDDLRLRVAAGRVDAGADRRGVEGAGRRPSPRGLRLPRRRQRRERGPARRDPAPRRRRLPERQGVHDQGVRDQRRGAPPGPAGRPAGRRGRQRPRREQRDARPGGGRHDRGGPVGPAPLCGEPSGPRGGRGHAPGDRLRAS